MNKPALVVWLIVVLGNLFCVQAPSTIGGATLTLIPSAVKTQDLTPKKKAVQPESNRVYIKVIMPTERVDEDKDRPVVESWIADDLKKLGQTKFTAVTGWVSLELCPITGIPERDTVWHGGKMGDSHYCSVGADIPERAKGRIKVLVNGWSPDGAEVTVTLTDEPGTRAIAAVKQLKTKHGMPYVAVLIGPPPEKPAAPADSKK